MVRIEPGESAELVSNHEAEGRYNFRIGRGFGWVSRTKGEAERQLGQFREVGDRGYWEVPADESVWAHNPRDVEPLIIEIEKQGFFTELFSMQRQKTPAVAAEERNSMAEFTATETVPAGTNSVFIQLSTDNNPEYFPMRVMGVTTSLQERLPTSASPVEYNAYITVDDGEGTPFEVSSNLTQSQLLLPEGLRYRIPNEPGYTLTVGVVNRTGSTTDILQHFLYQNLDERASVGFL